ncbi:ferrous iron transport protein B [Mobilisporobacter senegalensis]|uniref:Ferrous iron transport protein B n=1 Tax=Mobilisporobacter senegalensis TaxID=1329262 RepID=A0A3N1XJU9_9FIRM|nr:ferrous iron transport protein B [Mobilisporobacter senegalensis]ROR26411.1 ferrous iron transport protein B [Mobilisporobacter senegalensis]
MSDELRIGFVGNPNCGKTTLFNAYTGAKLKVANWPGVTVERKEGAARYHNHIYKLIDTPGIYSLTSYSIEEKVTRKFILEEGVDVIINIVDASSLERNLYLTLQLIELGKPVIMALNMMDIVEERGMEIDLHRLPEMLGIPVIPVSARKKSGLDILMHAASHHVKEHHKEYVVVYNDEIEEKINTISLRIKEKFKDMENVRWHAIKFLEYDEEVMKKYPMDLSDIIDRSYETDIINQKYDFIEEIIDEVLVNKATKEEKTDKIDKILTNRFLGIPIFLGIMAFVFYLTFTVGDFLKGGFDIALGLISDTVSNGLSMINASQFVTSLIIDGIIAGVGGILSFLPNIFILFLALAILEDSGYMSRVAYVMDGIMGKIGLSGKAFIPMLLGFGCSVPAIMASRTLENERDRRKTILITPFMSCSAKLPIYVLFSQMFFGAHAMMAAYSMYLIGLIMAIMVAFIMSKIGEKKENISLLIELPEYKAPNARSIGIYVWEKVKDYLIKAGTTIFIASIAVWFILNIGMTGLVDNMGDSFGAMIGKLLVPILKPAGLGLWQIGVALISGFAAKEVVVSSISVLYGINNVTSISGMNSLLELLANDGFTALNAYALMIFSLLYTPCLAAVATMKKELKSAKWTAFGIVFPLVVAWLITTLIYQIGGFILWQK